MLSVNLGNQLNLLSNITEDLESYLRINFDNHLNLHGANNNKFMGLLEEKVYLYQQNNDNDTFIYILNQFKSNFERIAMQKNDEDLIQELSEVLWNATKKYNVESGIKFKTFFWTCVHNHIGTKKIRKNAQKRSGSKKIKKINTNLETGDQEVVIEIFVPQVLSINSKIKNSDSSDSELGLFIENTMFKNQYIDMDFNICLQNLFDSGLLKENEKKAIKMVIDGETLFDIGKASGGKTASAIHYTLKRLSERKQIREYLLNILI